MDKEKKELLKEQITKIEDVQACLKQNFSDLEIDEEINFISISKDNLKALLK